MKKRFFSRFSRSGQPAPRAPVRVEGLAPGVVPRAEAAAAAAAGVADVVRGIARKGLPRNRSKRAISLRVDPDVLDWFRSQGPGYQTHMNAVLRAYVTAADAA